MTEAIDLPAQWRMQATDYLRIAKAYKDRCPSTEATRLGYVKTAAQLNECASQLEATFAHPSTQASARQAQSVGQEPVREAAHGDGQDASGEERADQAQGLLDVPGVWTGDEHAGG